MNRFGLRYNRVHAVGAELRRRSANARGRAAAELDQDSQFAASLRGKAAAYDEAAALVERLERNRPLRGKVGRWSHRADRVTS